MRSFGDVQPFHREEQAPASRAWPLISHVSLASGRRIKCLTTVTDDFSHECVDIAVGHGIGGEYVVRVLDQVARFRGYPQAVKTYQGPEFTCRAFMGWEQAKSVRHILNQPGKPTQNADIDSFNGKFRDECLNERWFQSLKQARAEIARWRIDYNEVRPHRSCGRMPPTKFAAQHRQTTGGAAADPGVASGFLKSTGTGSGGRSNRPASKIRSQSRHLVVSPQRGGVSPGTPPGAAASAHAARRPP